MIRAFIGLAAMAVGGAALLTGAPLPAFSAEAAQRIVVAGGAVTETVYALGAGDRIIAADTTSVHPAEAFTLPKVGYVRQLSAEGVLAQRPDLILLAPEAGPPAAIDQLSASSVPVVRIDAAWSPDGVAQLIRQTGDAIGKADAAEALAQDVEEDFAALEAAVPHEDQPSVLLLLNAGAGPLLGAGTGTAAEAIIDLAGGRLPFPDMAGYKPISLEPVLAADPDWIVVPSHMVDALGGMEAMKKLDVIASTSAGREGRVAIIDSLYLLGFGPRAPQAAADLAVLLHPEAEIPAVGGGTLPSDRVMRMGL